MKYTFLIKLLVLVVTMGFCHNFSFAQTEEVKNSFSVEELEQILVRSINHLRIQNKLDSFDIESRLVKIAQIQANYMSVNGKASTEQSGKLSTTGKRLQSVGGSKKAEEIVITTGISKGKDSFSSRQVAETILQKWQASKKDKPVILNPHNIFMGIGASTDKDGKKIYVSVAFGSYDSFNNGAKKKKELAIPFTSKNKKIRAGDSKSCKNCEKFKDYPGLISGLYEREGKIYLRYNDLKSFQKLMKGPDDALAIDIIQKAQYNKPDYNIFDNNLLSKGILLKKVKSDKIYQRNLFKEEEGKKVTQLDVCLGKIPKKLKGSYELNLLILQDNSVCKTLIPSYVENGEQESNTSLEMLLMPDSAAYFAPPFVPKAESTILNFIVPFEKNKFDYKQEDIQPLLDAMQEPDYLIEGLYIYAYSSIEGDSISNAQLQKKRAESIIKTFEEMQSNKILTNVKTSDSWNLFKLEMEDGKYDYLTKMKKKNAIQEINTKGLAEELEPYLSKQRFAQVILDITYEVKGAKEEKYSVMQFNKATRQGDVKLSYKIQYFIEKCIREGKYSKESLSKMEVPATVKNSGLLNNKVVFRYISNDKQPTEQDLIDLREIVKTDPANSFAKFNNLYCEVKLNPIGDTKQINSLQNQIDVLYTTNVPKKYVNALNTEFQFKIMEALDTVENSEAVIQACIEKIKSFYDFKASSWENSLKLAYVFMKFKDYKFSAGILEPFISQEEVNDQLLDAYVSSCALVPEKIKSRQFVSAMRKMRERNPEHFCEMIGSPKLTFQVLDNPLVKEEYIKANCNQFASE